MNLARAVESYTYTGSTCAEVAVFLVNTSAILEIGLHKFPMPAEAYHTAAIDLGYSPYLEIKLVDGVPTHEGKPVWDRLGLEDISAYQVFKAYRDLGCGTKKRTLVRLSRHLESQGIRIEFNRLRDLRVAYHWDYRVRAYDEFVLKEDEDMMVFRRINVMGRHASAGEQLFQVASDYLTGPGAQLLTPKLAIQLLKTAAELERLSVGLDPKRAGDVEPAIDKQLNIQYHVDSKAIETGAQEEATPAIDCGKEEEDKDKLARLLSVMDRVGIFEMERATSEGEETDESRPTTTLKPNTNIGDAEDPPTKT